MSDEKKQEAGEKAVNFDALTQPEGKYQPEEVTGNGQSASANGEEPQKKDGEEPTGADPQTTKGEEGQQTAFNPNPTWNILKEKLGVTVPEGLTAENEMETLANIFDQVNQAMPTLHPIAKELNDQLSNPEFNYDDWLRSQSDNVNILNLEGRAFFEKALVMKFPDAKEEDINQMIIEFENSNSMKFQEMQLKSEIKARHEQEKTKMTETAKAQFQASIDAENKQVEKDLTDLFAVTEKINEIYGIPVSEADKGAFNSTFKELVRRGPDGRIPLEQILQSNEAVWRFAYMELFGDPKIKEALSNAKEGTKSSVWNKLKGKPFEDGLGKPGGQPGTKKPNYDNLTRPEGS
jgi:hypothetical protein